MSISRWMDKKAVVHIHNGVLLLLLLLSCFSRVWLCATPETAAYQVPPSLAFSRQEYWSGLPFPSPVHESEKWKWSCSVVSDSERPNRLQPTRLLHLWDFPGKSTGVGWCIYMELRKMVTITLYTRQQKRHWCIEQSFGLCGRGRGWDDLGEWHWNMYNIIYETSHQSRFDAWYWMLGAGALGRPRGMVWGGRREEGSGWGTRVHFWRIHVDIWQNQYNIVKLKNKKK